MQTSSITSGITITRTSQTQRAAKMMEDSSVFTIPMPTAASSTQVSISDAARDMSARFAEASNEFSSQNEGRGFRVDGAVFIPLVETAIEKTGKFTVYQMTDDQIAEAKLHDEQVKAREVARNQYSAQHPDQVYGQIFTADAAGNKHLLATVWMSGTAETPHKMSLTNDGYGISLAETRLKEIAETVHGTIVYSDVAPDPYWYSANGVPESVLPNVTARSAFEIMKEVFSTPELKAAQSITFTSVEQYDTYRAGNFTSARQWNEYLQNQASS